MSVKLRILLHRIQAVYVNFDIFSVSIRDDYASQAIHCSLSMLRHVVYCVSFLTPLEVLKLLFQSIREALDNVQSSLQTAEQTQQEAMTNANSEENLRIAELMTSVQQHWTMANTQYNDRHRSVTSAVDALGFS